MDELTRRSFVGRASALGVAAMVAQALPVADGLGLLAEAPAEPSLMDATFQAFCDTIIPGRKATRTDLGDEIHPLAIAGVDSEPGAVEADALRLSKDPLIGFDAIAPVLFADLDQRALLQGGAFLTLGFDKRAAVVAQGLDFANTTRVIYEAGAAVPFTAFCAGAPHPIATDRNCSGFAVMGHPGAAPNGYQDFSYRRKLGKGRTVKGSMP